MTATRRSLLAVPALAALAAPYQPARAQNFPSRPIRLLVGFAPGGATDIAARLLQPLLGEALGQSIVVENRSGGGGNVATELLMQSAPDGHTVMLASPGQLVVNPVLNPRFDFDAVRDTAPIGQTTSSPLILVVPAASPYRDAQALVAAARAQPGRLNYASAGVGSSMHIAGEMLKAFGGLQIEHVPYRGSGPAVTDLIAGKVDFMIDSVSTTATHIRNGVLRALAQTGSEPFEHFPGIPLLADVVPGVVLTTWLGLVGPAGLPAPVLARLASVLGDAVRSPGFAQRLRDLGSQAYWAGPEAFAAHLVAERRRAADVVQRAGIRLE
ncbi:Bug family tripartite tricarboxylate transporter substrate binding protein [Falsiroseomonas tokyonensis]|uniref:Bug family tripartite tricarboxylate transporter substrate binding protein n=1 Tax=Falsiroseomonas tokyonensis TaxID=430521 RepID=A0ABV7BXA7_9PROT|nr:tripartite tricarboxylate transporter substrate binding protein [Falsiroseomonas tokyonensis]MBU8540163.1 tripartite tricarboxylate transporter substrate binding protein [Falsiroseomonas tokyonensis]